MRYLVAIFFAIVCAFLTFRFVSPMVELWVLNRQVFESPDQADNLGNLVFMGTNVLGLLVGWVIGWSIGGGARNRPEDA